MFLNSFITYSILNISLKIIGLLLSTIRLKMTNKNESKTKINNKTNLFFKGKVIVRKKSKNVFGFLIVVEKSCFSIPYEKFLDWQCLFEATSSCICWSCILPCLKKLENMQFNNNRQNYLPIKDKQPTSIN